MSMTQETLESLIQKAKNSTKDEANTLSLNLNKAEEPSKEQLSIPKPEVTALEISSVESIITAKDKISKVKQSLGVIVDTMTQNPSFFNQAATYYGGLSLWKKIALGVGISVPTLAVGLFAEIGILLVLGGATVVTYTATGIILEDHHLGNLNTAERLKTGVINLADVLELVIKALDKIGEELALEVAKFKTENLKLAENVAELTSQVSSLSEQVALYIETEKVLRETKKNLEETAATLKKSVGKQSELLQKNQQELAQVTKDYRRSQEQLSAKVDELKIVREAMEKEVKKVNQLSATLEKTVTSFSTVVKADKENKEAFLAKLEACQSELDSQQKVNTRLSKAEEGLAKGKTEFEIANSRYNELLSKQEELVKRLEAIDQQLSLQPKSAPKENVSQLLALKGLYAKNSTPIISAEKLERADQAKNDNLKSSSYISIL